MNWRHKDDSTAALTVQHPGVHKTEGGATTDAKSQQLPNYTDPGAVRCGVFPLPSPHTEITPRIRTTPIGDPAENPIGGSSASSSELLNIVRMPKKSVADPIHQDIFLHATRRHANRHTNYQGRQGPAIDVNLGHLVHLFCWRGGRGAAARCRTNCIGLTFCQCSDRHVKKPFITEFGDWGRGVWPQSVDPA
jgi:hypothetical protein